MRVTTVSTQKGWKLRLHLLPRLRPGLPTGEHRHLASHARRKPAGGPSRFRNWPVESTSGYRRVGVNSGLRRICERGWDDGAGDDVDASLARSATPEFPGP